MATIEKLDYAQWNRVLVVVAHPDDPEYGLSAAVKEWTEYGIDVSYLLLTRGEAGIQAMDPEETGPLRVAEQRAACDVVGVSNLTILHHPDSMLIYGLDLRRDIAREIRLRKPDAVVTANFDLEAYGGLNQADHRVAGLATIDGVRDAANPWAHRDLLEQEGLQPWSTEQLLIFGAAKPTHVLEVASTSVEAAVASLEAHKDYLKALPNHPKPAEFIPASLRAGSELIDDPITSFAVAFQVFDM